MGSFHHVGVYPSNPAGIGTRRGDLRCATAGGGGELRELAACVRNNRDQSFGGPALRVGLAIPNGRSRLRRRLFGELQLALEPADAVGGDFGGV